ncbi:MAG: carboxylesterase/lipase family protein [Oscillospiraceae bacterium]|nr:carboxylesterase/lipase family protein [Oscillospiraceae bacterium]
MRDVLALTKYGKIRGDYFEGVYRFLGVRYMKPPVGELRFMLPQKPDVSPVIVDAKQYALKCWQTDTPRTEVPEVANSPFNLANQEILTGNMEMGKGPQSEDCCALNVWTPSLTKGQHLPVMVWLHGGANTSGTAECPHQDEFNMAKKNNVVVVSVSHRLSMFGYMDLSYLGVEKYSHTVNLGDLDMVAALEWVRDNINWFGGDPDNVTIWGESGGGGKVARLMGMPAAKGLFHKAIIQSSGFRVSSPEACRKDTEAFLEHLGITKDNLDDLQKMPAEDLIKAMREINAERGDGPYLDFPIEFDGEIIKYDPFDGAEGSEFCKDIPLIFCYTKQDTAMQALFNPGLFEVTDETLPPFFVKLGFTEEQAKKIAETYTDMLDHDATAFDKYIAFINDRRYITALSHYLEVREGKDAAPLYNAVFAFESPDPYQKAVHGTDVPFFFDNAELAPYLYTAANKAAAYSCSDTCGSAWAAYAYNSNDPTGRSMPEWKPYDREHRYSMVFKAETELVSDYHSEGRILLEELSKEV